LIFTDDFFAAFVFSVFASLAASVGNIKEKNWGILIDLDLRNKK